MYKGVKHTRHEKIKPQNKEKMKTQNKTKSTKNKLGIVKNNRNKNKKKSM